MSDISDPASPRLDPSVSAKSRFGCGFYTVLAGIFLVIIALILPAVYRSAPDAARRMQCKINLHNIGLALWNYADAYHALPPAYTIDANGRPLHSWRTLLLPYLDQKPLYDSIDLTRPWNDPVNAKAYQTRIAVYRCPAFGGPATQTTYMALAAPGSCFLPSESRLPSDITDGTSNTLMVIEVPIDRAVHWMSPFDANERLILEIAEDSKLAHAGGVNALFCDGTVRFLSARTSKETRRALITVAGGDRVEEF
ncbi:MAG: DUF1559 domain-containing protein [Planctomycetales bacterium]